MRSRKCIASACRGAQPSRSRPPKADHWLKRKGDSDKDGGDLAQTGTDLAPISAQCYRSCTPHWRSCNFRQSTNTATAFSGQNGPELEPSGPNYSNLSQVSDDFQIIYNIHNHEIVNGDSVALCNSIKSDIDLCALDLINSNLFLAGDFRWTSTQGKAYSFSDPVATVEMGRLLAV